MPRLVQLIPHQEFFASIQGWSDTDHAGCVRTRKSTTGTVVQLGKAVIKATAKSQAVIALSREEVNITALSPRPVPEWVNKQCWRTGASDALSSSTWMPPQAYPLEAGEALERSSTSTRASSGCRRLSTPVESSYARFPQETCWRT